MEIVKAITIYGASSSKIDSFYIQTARELGTLMASLGISCINGGGGNGIMGAVSDAVLESNGRTTGIIPQFMIDEGWVHNSLSEVIITPDMHTRKQLLASKGDACIALPGGIGTMEELLEIMTWKQLGLYHKPIVILNAGGYYNPLLAMFEKAVDGNFMHQQHVSIWTTASSASEALELALEQKLWHADPRSIAAV